jgi:hypothetical protein
MSHACHASHQSIRSRLTLLCLYEVNLPSSAPFAPTIVVSKPVTVGFKSQDAPPLNYYSPTSFCPTLFNPKIQYSRIAVCVRSYLSALVLHPSIRKCANAKLQAVAKRASNDDVKLCKHTVAWQQIELPVNITAGRSDPTSIDHFLL